MKVVISRNVISPILFLGANNLIASISNLFKTLPAKAQNNDIF